MTAQGTIFHNGIGKRPTTGVGQDKTAPQSYRAKQFQPDAHPKESLQRHISPDTTAESGTKKHSTKRQTEATTVWLPLPLKAEAQRVAGQLGLSVSALGAKFFEVGLRQNIETQHATLLEPMVQKAIRTQMRRKTELDVLCQFDQSQILRLLYNILARLPDAQQMSEETLNQIRDESASAAHKDLRRRLEHQRTLLGDALQDLHGEEGAG